MDLIDKLSKSAREGGLPVEELKPDSCLLDGSAGATVAIEETAKAWGHASLYGDIRTTLWGSGGESNKTPGLLSGLNDAVLGTKAKVVAALQLCESELARRRTDGNMTGTSIDC